MEEVKSEDFGRSVQVQDKDDDEVRESESLSATEELPLPVEIEKRLRIQIYIFASFINFLCHFQHCSRSPTCCLMPSVTSLSSVSWFAVGAYYFITDKELHAKILVMLSVFSPFLL